MASCSVRDSRSCGPAGRVTSRQRPGDNRLVLAAPVATDHGKPITGRVAYEVIVAAPTETARFAGLLGTVYRPAVDGAPDAVLTERKQPEGERTTIDRARWSFIAAPGGGWPTELHLRDGFKPGRIYELVYTARDPIVVALGMAGIRDLLSVPSDTSAGRRASAAAQHHFRHLAVRTPHPDHAAARPACR